MIQPWINNGKINDKNQDHVRFLTQDTQQWQDGKNEPGWVHSSICEISQSPMKGTIIEIGKDIIKMKKNGGLNNILKTFFVLKLFFF